MLQLRPDQPEHGRAEQQPAEELSHHRRLAYSLHQFAETAADQQQDAKLGEKYRLRSAGNLPFRSQGDRNSAKQKHRGHQAAPRMAPAAGQLGDRPRSPINARMVRRPPLCSHYAFSVGLAGDSGSVGQRSCVSGTIMRMEKPSRV